MSLSTARATQGRSLVGTLGLALAVALVMVGLALGPALSKDNERRPGPQERGRRAHQPSRREYRPYGYYPPPPVIYAPPPVVYVPPPSPGISLFFDLPIRIR
jgi:hypothetical protein